MIGFTQINDAATFRLPLRLYFVALHLCFAAILAFGIFHTDFYSCHKSKYPVAFQAQYFFFFISYGGFWILHCNGYFLKWNDLGDNEEMLLNNDGTSSLQSSQLSESV